MTRNILVVWSTCDSESGSRINKLVKYLVKRCHNVTFIVRDVRSNIQGAKVIELSPFPDPCAVLRYMGFKEHAARLIRFLYVPDQFVLFSGKVLLHIFKYHKDYDCIITSSPQEGIHLAGFWSKKLFGLPWIADFRDMWTQNTYRFTPPSKLHDYTCKKLERKFFRDATCVIANTPPFGEMVTKWHNVPPHRVFAITNGFDKDDIANVKRESKSGNRGRTLYIAHNGQLDKGEKAPMVKVLQGIRRANDRGANVVLNVYGQQTKKVADTIKSFGASEYVVLQGHKRHRESLNLLGTNDALLVYLEELDYTDKIVPLKLYEYIGIPRPILAIIPPQGYAADVLRIIERGWVFSPIDDLGEIFIDFYQRWERGLISAKTGCQKNQFSWDQLVLKWENVINQATEG